MLAELGLRPLLSRVCGERADDVADQIARAVERVSRLGAPGAVEAGCAEPARAFDHAAPSLPILVEINPLMVTLDGRRVVAADALVQLSDVQLSESPDPRGSCGGAR